MVMDCCGSIFLNRAYRGGQTVLARHRHVEAYLALVLSGGYEEAGDRGCFRVKAGDVVLHSAYEAHIDRYNATGAEVLDLALPRWATFAHATMHIADPDAIVRSVERDPREALNMVLALMRPAERAVDDWPHRLAGDLERNPHLRFGAWARDHHLADATLSRGFQRVFGVTPNAYRAQQRALHATRMAATSRASLTDIAHTTGFVDQAHMTHAVRTLTGQTPGQWRRQSA